MPLAAKPELEILLPVHNEAGSIERVLSEIHSEISGRIPYRFLICEDGSRDRTKEILRSLSSVYPMRLDLSEARKGYSQAVLDGMKKTEAPWLLCLDSDGQCDIHDLWQFWQLRNSADICLGWRNQRADTFLRKFLSRTFYFLYQSLFHIPVHDPSCPFLLIRRAALDRFIGGMAIMREGFWWEFIARAHRSGLRIRELRVNHRARLFGKTQVYRFSKMPGIGFSHLRALFQIHFQTKRAKSEKKAA